MQGSPTRRLDVLAVPGAFLLTLGLRFALLRDRAVDLPFHDQWDAEGLHLLRPWKAGANLAPYLFRFHNEHHPVLTKLIALMFAAGDGMWSALPQLLLNTIFQGLIVVMLGRLAARLLPPRSAWFVTACSAVALSLPLLWENLLWGFQSQFYLAILLGLVHLEFTWSEPRLGWRWCGGAIAAVLLLGTIAAGFLPVIASGLVALLRLRLAGPARTHARATLVLAVAVAAFGFRWINPVPYPAVAHTPFSAFEAFTILESWPFTLPLALLLVPLPAALFFFGQTVREGVRPSQPWLLAAVLWLGAVTAAFAFGRAELITSATPRYCDFLTVQILVGLVCWLQLAAMPTAARPRFQKMAAAWTLALAAGLWLGVTATARSDALGERHELQVAQQSLVRGYLLGGNQAVLGDSRPARLIHESPAQRAALLNDPGIRALLPTSVRPPLVARGEADTSHVRPCPYLAGDLTTPGWQLEPTAADPARFVSGLILPESFPLLRFRVAGGVDGHSHRLRLLVGSDNHGVDPLAATHGESGQYLNFPMPTVPFRIEAAAAAGSGPLLFSEPVSLSRLSWLTGKIFGAHAVFTFAGIGLMALAGFGAWRMPAVASDGFAPTQPVLLRQLLATVAVALALVALAFWPRPLVFDLSSREAILLDPTAWSGERVDHFRLAAGAGSTEFAAGGVYPSVPGAGEFLGSYGPNGDADQAQAVSDTFAIEHRWLCVPLAGYPQAPANTLAVEIIDQARRVVATLPYAGGNPAERPVLWLVDLQAHRGLRARLRLADGETGHLGWFGIGTPWQADDATAAHSWQMLADSNRLQRLRWCLLAGAVVAALAWQIVRRRKDGHHAPGTVRWP